MKTPQIWSFLGLLVASSAITTAGANQTESSASGKDVSRIEVTAEKPDLPEIFYEEPIPAFLITDSCDTGDS